MSTQNPFFSFFSTYPGGTPLNNPDITQSKGIEIGADGPPGDPLEITDTHGGALKVLTPPGSVFNQSGRYLHRELNMLGGVHTFGVRTNSSSKPSEWVLTVVESDLPNTEDFESAPNQGAFEVGQFVSTSTIKITLTGKFWPSDHLAIAKFVDTVDANGQAFYGYLGQINGQITSLSYDVELIGRTANRLLIWIAGGNITGIAQMNLIFRDAAGATLNIINRTVTALQRQQQIDTGPLNGIKSIAVVVNGQVIIDRIQFL
ncbi:hypothetical protein DXT77_15295 [Pseudomonas sp. 91RF]|uniref:hypothetical protein n=1 Tax=Pseudomonas sp. 91RF TaxID=2292261 RepID=UPI000E6608B9|nr:hypothetical protein [Pseudomonas sp. 91RF]RIJ09810.1 hypothetical protein DXT77_15295 [Pseudomonas sp. 91RF]